MNSSSRIYKMTFQSIYKALVEKALKNQKTINEVDLLFNLFTGYAIDMIHEKIDTDITYIEFLKQSPLLNPNRNFITGKVCGVDIVSIEDEDMKLIRYMDKLIDDLAKGKTVEAIKLKYNL